jgi:hypothetical protein
MAINEKKKDKQIYHYPQTHNRRKNERMKYELKEVHKRHVIKLG